MGSAGALAGKLKEAVDEIGKNPHKSAFCMFTRGCSSNLDSGFSTSGDEDADGSSVHWQITFSTAALCCKWSFISYKIHGLPGN